MSHISVAVACSDPEITDFLCDFLTTFEYEICALTSYGFDCFRAVEKYNPDLVICSPYLYDTDAIGLIREMKKSKSIKTEFVVAGNMSNLSVADKVATCGARFYTLVPFDYLYMDSKLHEIADKSISQRENTYEQMPDADQKPLISVNAHLHELGLPSSVRGYKYICDGVSAAYANRDILNSLTKQLYPYIAKLNCTSDAAVERAIRGAISRIWDRGSYSAITAVFGSCAQADAPTNGEFISILTEHIRQELL